MAISPLDSDAEPLKSLNAYFASWLAAFLFFFSFW